MLALENDSLKVINFFMGIEFAHQTYNIGLTDFDLIFFLIKSTNTKAAYTLFPVKKFPYLDLNPFQIFASLKSKWCL